LYKLYNPAEIDLFPKCPVYHFTDTKCPGCGSQRAINQLLNGNLTGAFSYNALLVIALPYLLVGFIGQEIDPIRKSRFWDIFYRNNATIIILVIVIGYWVFRNIFGF